MLILALFQRELFLQIAKITGLFFLGAEPCDIKNKYQITSTTFEYLLGDRPHLFTEQSILIKIVFGPSSEFFAKHFRWGNIKCGLSPIYYHLLAFNS